MTANWERTTTAVAPPHFVSLIAAAVSRRTTTTTRRRSPHHRTARITISMKMYLTIKQRNINWWRIRILKRKTKICTKPKSPPLIQTRFCGISVKWSFPAGRHRIRLPEEFYLFPFCLALYHLFCILFSIIFEHRRHQSELRKYFWKSKILAWCSAVCSIDRLIGWLIDW